MVGRNFLCFEIAIVEMICIFLQIFCFFYLAWPLDDNVRGRGITLVMTSVDTHSLRAGDGDDDGLCQ